MGPGVMLAAAVAMAATPVADARADDAETAAPEAAGSDPGQAKPLPWQPGPARVDLGHELGLDLPEHYMYLPPGAAAKVLERMGSFHNEDVLGIATSTAEDANWFVVISYDAEGFVKDDESIDAEALLSSMREGLDEANDEREERGFERLALEGWAEPPRYERERHHLVWALVVSDNDGKSVNYNTRILGRHGYASLNLVTEPSALGQFKRDAETLLGRTSFGAGARFEDFDAASDRTAEYGLAGSSPRALAWARASWSDGVARQVLEGDPDRLHRWQGPLPRLGRGRGLRQEGAQRAQEPSDE